MTNRSRAPEIRVALTNSVDGMTALDLAELIGCKRNVVYNALRRMPDAYIDRWYQSRNGKLSSVWCVIVKPEDCPRPSVKKAASK